METSSVSKSRSVTKSEPSINDYHAHVLRISVYCRVHDLENQGLYSNPTQYYDFLQNRVMIVFRPKFEESDQEYPEFSLVLSKKQNYDVVSIVVNILRHRC